MQELTVKDLREALEGVPDDLPVRLSSDSGVDQGYGEIIVEKARWIKGEDGWFDIRANDHCDDMPDCERLPNCDDMPDCERLPNCDDMPDCERLPNEEFDRIMELLGERGK